MKLTTRQLAALMQKRRYPSLRQNYQSIPAQHTSVLRDYIRKVKKVS